MSLGSQLHSCFSIFSYVLYGARSLQTACSRFLCQLISSQILEVGGTGRKLGCGQKEEIIAVASVKWQWDKFNNDGIAPLLMSSVPAQGVHSC